MHISPHGVFAGGRIRSGNPQAHDAGRLQPGAFGFVFHVVQINLGFSIPNLPRPLGANVSAREYFWQSLRVPSSASLDDQFPNYSVDSGDSQRILLMGVRCNASRADPARLDACAAVLLGGERRPADTRIATHYPICDRAMPVACNSSAVATHCVVPAFEAHRKKGARWTGNRRLVNQLSARSRTNARSGGHTVKI